MTFLKHIFPNVVPIWSGDGGVTQAIWQTLYMTIVTTIVSAILGLILGVFLVLWDEDGLVPNKPAYFILDKIVNIFRAIPFIILLAVMYPVTHAIVGTGIGPTAALVPLIAGTAPFFARQVQNALLTVDPGVIEAAEAMGLSPAAIVWRVYLREGLGELVRATVLTIISVIGLTAMAGAVGGGGLGNLAIAIGYQRFQNDVIWVATIFILIMVFIFQFVGDWINRKLQH
ncbi:methionine ABC transporter permease [Lacticaseibacillus jixiensis]|uniref:methionine ABC transporter permease n=1 Tax=Lacticaseibacillus jixiensis TaxID=3231926 RepID=UPI0036F3F2B6